MESIFQKTGDSCQRKRHIAFMKAHHFTPVPIRSPTQATNIVKPSHQHDFIDFLIFWTRNSSASQLQNALRGQHKLASKKIVRVVVFR